MNETQPTAVRKVRLQELDPAGDSAGSPIGVDEINLLRNVKVKLGVSVGACDLTVRELFDLQENSILSLNKKTSEPLEVYLDDKLIARGTLVAVDEDFGIKITEILPPTE